MVRQPVELANEVAQLTVVAVAPEPVSMLLFGTGLLAIGTMVRRRWLTAAKVSESLKNPVDL